MSTIFELYWPREIGCDAGTRVTAHQLEAVGLDAAVRQRVLALVKEDDPVLRLQLPFLDQRESRRRGEVLRAAHFVREGNVIRGVSPGNAAALRDLAAHTVLTARAWSEAPAERDPHYFRTWQSVSVTLQRALRLWVSEIYFRDAARFEDRAACYPILLYSASRPCHGRPRTEFTYDLADPEVLDYACRMSGQALQTTLEKIEKRLYAEGRPALARRYAPMWYEDMIRAVRERPRPLIDILAKEAMLVNAVIDLGTSRPNSGSKLNMSSVKPFARATNVALRGMAGVNMRELAGKIIAEATSTLEKANALERQAHRMPLAS